MKKQKNVFQLKNQSGGAGTETVTNILLLIYVIIYFTNIYQLSQYIYTYQKYIVLSKNTQSICKQNAYENELIRYHMTRFLDEHADSKKSLQKMYYTNYIVLFLIASIIILLNLFTNSIGNKFPMSSFISILGICFMAGSIHLVENRINQIYTVMDEYKSDIHNLTELLFTAQNFGQLTLTYNREEIIREITDAAKEHAKEIALRDPLATDTTVNVAISLATDAAEVNVAASAVMIHGATRASIKKTLSEISGDQSVNEALLQAAVDNIPLDKSSTNGALITLEESIIRRLLHGSNNPDILTTADALHYYDLKRQTDAGRFELIGYINFTHNSADYKLIQEAICGTTICSQGIGQRLKTLSADAFTSFIATIYKCPVKLGVQSSPSSITSEVVIASTPAPAPASADAYISWLNDFVKQIVTYDIELAKQIKVLAVDDAVWDDLKQIHSQTNIQDCICKYNLFNLSHTDKSTVLQILNNLASQSYYDPLDTLVKYFGNTGPDFSNWRNTLSILLSSSILGALISYGMNMSPLLEMFSIEISSIITAIFASIILGVFYTLPSNIIYLYIISLYYIFHYLYNVYDKKKLIGGYFIILIIVAISLALTLKY